MRHVNQRSVLVDARAELLAEIGEAVVDLLARGRGREIIIDPMNRANETDAAVNKIINPRYILRERPRPLDGKE